MQIGMYKLFLKHLRNTEALSVPTDKGYYATKTEFFFAEAGTFSQHASSAFLAHKPGMYLL